MTSMTSRARLSLTTEVEQDIAERFPCHLTKRNRSYSSIEEPEDATPDSRRRTRQVPADDRRRARRSTCMIDARNSSMAIAVEDEDGFASTIVQLQPDEQSWRGNRSATRKSPARRTKKTRRARKERRTKTRRRKTRPGTKTRTRNRPLEKDTAGRRIRDDHHGRRANSLRGELEQGDRTREADKKAECRRHGLKAGCRYP